MDDADWGDFKDDTPPTGIKNESLDESAPKHTDEPSSFEAFPEELKESPAAEKDWTVEF